MTYYLILSRKIPIQVVFSGGFCALRRAGFWHRLPSKLNPNGLIRFCKQVLTLVCLDLATMVCSRIMSSATWHMKPRTRVPGTVEGAGCGGGMYCAEIGGSVCRSLTHLCTHTWQCVCLSVCLSVVVCVCADSNMHVHGQTYLHGHDCTRTWVHTIGGYI